jgi:hypothetical protein
MLTKLRYDLALRFLIPTTVIHLLHVHPSRRPDLVATSGEKSFKSLSRLGEKMTQIRGGRSDELRDPGL